jgi:hypothetical protein
VTTGTEAGGEVAYGEAITLSFTLTEGEYVRARRIWRARRWPRTALPCVLLIGLGFAFNIRWAIVAGAGLLVADAYTGFLRAPRRAWQQIPALRAAQRITCDDEAITMEWLDVTSRVKWTRCDGVARLGDSYGARFGDGLAVIPRRVFATEDDERSFRELIQSHATGRATKRLRRAAAGAPSEGAE